MDASRPQGRVPSPPIRNNTDPEQETRVAPNGRLGPLGRAAHIRGMVTIFEKSRRRLPKGALSFASEVSVALQLTALAMGAALGWLVADASRAAFASLVAAYQQSAPGDWLSEAALLTTAWVLVFLGSTLLFNWGLSRALRMVIVPLARRRRFQSEAYFGPGLKSQPRLDS